MTRFANTEDGHTDVLSLEWMLLVHEFGVVLGMVKTSLAIVSRLFEFGFKFTNRKRRAFAEDVHFDGIFGALEKVAIGHVAYFTGQFHQAE